LSSQGRSRWPGHRPLQHGSAPVRPLYPARGDKRRSARFFRRIRPLRLTGSRARGEHDAPVRWKRRAEQAGAW